MNGLGEFFFSIEADEGSGVTDVYAGASEDEPLRALMELEG